MREIIAEQLNCDGDSITRKLPLKKIWEQILWIYLNWLWRWKMNIPLKFLLRSCRN